MTQLEELNVLRDLADKMQAHSAGVLALFKSAGVESDSPTLKELARGKDMNPGVFEEELRYLYPEKYRTANSAGYDLTSIVVGVLAGAGTGLFSMYSSDTARIPGKQETALAEQAAASNRRTLYLILGIVIVLIIASVIIFKGRGRR